MGYEAHFNAKSPAIMRYKGSPVLSNCFMISVLVKDMTLPKTDGY